MRVAKSGVAPLTKSGGRHVSQTMSVVKLPELARRKEKKLCEVDYGFLKPQTRKYARKLWQTLASVQPKPAPGMFEEVAVLDVACHVCGDVSFRRLMRRSLSPATYSKVTSICFDVAYRLRIEPTYLKAVAMDLR
jgi:hypothetical protein